MRGYEARYDSWCSELARIDSQLPERPHVATLATRIPCQNKTTSLCTQNTHRLLTESWLVFLVKTKVSLGATESDGKSLVPSSVFPTQPSFVPAII